MLGTAHLDPAASLFSACSLLGWQGSAWGKVLHAYSPAARHCLSPGGGCQAGVLWPPLYVHGCVSVHPPSPSSLHCVSGLSVGASQSRGLCLWTVSSHLLPRKSLGLPLSGAVLLLLALAVFHSVLNWPRACIRSAWGLTCCCEGEVQSVTLVEAGDSGLAASIPEPTAALPAPSQCRVAFGAAQVPLIAALCSWDSTTNNIHAVTAGSRQGSY